MVKEKVKNMLNNKTAGFVTGGVSIAALTLIWNVFINPLRGEVKDIRVKTQENKEVNIKQDENIKSISETIKRIDDNVELILKKIHRIKKQ